jgi:hypothetical protein
VTIDDRDDLEYWNALADRVAAAAARRTRIDAVGWLAHSRVAWALTCLLGVTALTFAAGARRAGAGTGRVELSVALAPADGVGKAIVLDQQPPAIGALLIEQPSRGQR